MGTGAPPLGPPPVLQWLSGISRAQRTALNSGTFSASANISSIAYCLSGKDPVSNDLKQDVAAGVAMLLAQ
eukprot:973465-Prorocentrum_minimum.AAC.1